jgi:hypothetical protein
MTVKIEKHYYGHDSTEEEIEAIRGRVYLYKDDIIMYKEIPAPSIFSLDLFFDNIKEITGTFSSFYMIIDLTEAERPRADIRNHLKKRFPELKNLEHASVFTEKNFMLNIAAKFVMTGIGLKSFSVHKTLEEALEAIYAKKQV